MASVGGGGGVCAASYGASDEAADDEDLAALFRDNDTKAGLPGGGRP